MKPRATVAKPRWGCLLPGPPPPAHARSLAGEGAICGQRPAAWRRPLRPCYNAHCPPLHRPATGCGNGPVLLQCEILRPGPRALHPAGHYCAQPGRPAKPEPVQLCEQQSAAVYRPVEDKEPPLLNRLFHIPDSQVFLSPNHPCNPTERELLVSASTVQSWGEEITFEPPIVPDEGTKTYSFPVITGGAFIYGSVAPMQMNVARNGDVLK